MLRCTFNLSRGQGLLVGRNKSDRGLAERSDEIMEAGEAGGKLRH